MDKGRVDDSTGRALPFGSSDSRCSTVCIVGIHKKTGGMGSSSSVSSPWAVHGQPGPVQSSAVHKRPGWVWPDVKKVRSEAQSYIRRFLGPAVEPCCLLVLRELTVR